MASRLVEMASPGRRAYQLPKVARCAPGSCWLDCEKGKRDIVPPSQMTRKFQTPLERVVPSISVPGRYFKSDPDREAGQ